MSSFKYLLVRGWSWFRFKSPSVSGFLRHSYVSAPIRVGQGPLRFAFGPLTEAASWGLQREAAGGRRSKTPTPEREAGAVNSGNEETGAEAGAVRAHTEADRRKAVFPVSCDCVSQANAFNAMSSDDCP